MLLQMYYYENFVMPQSSSSCLSLDNTPNDNAGFNYLQIEIIPSQQVKSVTIYNTNDGNKEYIEFNYSDNKDSFIENIDLSQGFHFILSQYPAITDDSANNAQSFSTRSIYSNDAFDGSKNVNTDSFQGKSCIGSTG